MIICTMARNYFKINSYTTLTGMAPRNKKERDLLKLLAKHNYRDREED